MLRTVWPAVLLCMAQMLHGTEAKRQRQCVKGMNGNAYNSRTYSYEIHKYVNCDSVTDGGGWIYVQLAQNRRIINWTRSWSEYKDGFGFRANSWLGLDNLHTLTSEGQWEVMFLCRNMKTRKRHTARYSRISVDNEAEGYRLRFWGEYKGDLRNKKYAGMYCSNDTMFTTYDRQNDGGFKNCAVEHLGGWWFREWHGCFGKYDMCSGASLTGDMTQSNLNGAYWIDYDYQFYCLYCDVTHMKIRKV